MKGKVKSMSEIRNIIHRLKMGQTKRQIHRELGVHRSTIRELNRLAVTHQWLDNESPMPSDEEIAKLWNQKSRTQSHPLDIYKEQIENWDKEGLTSVVIYQLLKDKCPCDVQAVRRYRNRHFPKTVEPVMVRSTVPGKDMEVDFGELGKFIIDDQIEKKVWLFSLRLRHSGRVYREIVLDQTLHTFLMGHVHALQKEAGVEKPKLRDVREALKKWNQEVADIHLVHGIGRSPFELFKSEEEKALQPLPKHRWEPTSWSQCSVRREWRIMLNNAYYSVPYQLIGETVEACVTYSLVRIFHKHKEVALHEKATKKWEYKRKAEHAPPFKEAVLQCSREGLLALAS
jgi:hypothetical protein